ncbi:unnamed protein product [Phaedon cochleariae]|uniref:Uncharacterized protein n=1 Tax=Phaedon cochleariae TaxID=80249 RepID=A0A9P0DUL7_PHACE|nr:unnamed protein product [Phaedon cochleariae]
MSNILQILQNFRNWRIDAEEVHPRAPSTPIITILPPIEDVEKALKEDENEKEVIRSESYRSQIMSWLLSSIRSLKAKIGLKSTSENTGELQNMLPGEGKSHRLSNASDKPPEGLCLITQSPFRILRAAESGNLETFQRLFYAEPTRLAIRDSKGKTAAHQAAARNRVNILQFILEQGGDLDNQDNVGNTPLHGAVEHESLDAVDFLLRNAAPKVAYGVSNKACTDHTWAEGPLVRSMASW